MLLVMIKSNVQIQDYTGEKILWEAQLGKEPVIVPTDISPIVSQIKLAPFTLEWFFTATELEGLGDRVAAISSQAPISRPNPNHWSIIDDNGGQIRYRRVGVGAVNCALPAMKSRYEEEMLPFVTESYKGYEPIILRGSEHPYSIWDIPPDTGTDLHIDGRPITSVVKLDSNTEWNTTIVHPDPGSDAKNEAPILLRYQANSGFFWDLRSNPHQGRPNTKRRIGMDINFGSAIFSSDHSVDATGVNGAYLLTS